jgi:hypothetical protein
MGFAAEKVKLERQTLAHGRGGGAERGVLLTEVCPSNFILAANTSFFDIQFRPPPKMKLERQTLAHGRSRTGRSANGGLSFKFHFFGDMAFILSGRVSPPKE